MAAAGATGTRSWLQAQHQTWLTPKRRRAAIIALFVAAFGFCSVTLSGSMPPSHSGQSRSAGSHQPH